MRSHYTNPAIHKAFDALERLSADQEVRRLADVREKALHDQNWMLSSARQEGRQEGEVIGQIRALQRVLHHPVLSSDELSACSLTELQTLLLSLEAELN